MTNTNGGTLADFTEVFTSEFAVVKYNENLNTFICTATSEYIPIEIFKQTFASISALMEKKSAQALIFDKRTLNTFHQPSMEWYFAIWKQEVKVKGLVNHYKILPEAEWFKTAVEAGKHDIYKKYGSAILEGITIKYINSPEEGIKDILSELNR